MRKRMSAKTKRGLWMRLCGQCIVMGKKTSYGVKQWATEKDLSIVEVFKLVLMGACRGIQRPKDRTASL